MLIEILKAVLFGIVEGITEWLPISSTGHMILVDQFVHLNVSADFYKMFEVVIQLGAIMAVVVLFWNKLWPFHMKNEKPAWKDGALSMWLKIIVAVIPAAIIGVLFDDKIDELFYHPVPVAIALIVVGVLFIVVETIMKGKKPSIRNIGQITYKAAVIIGLFQVLAAVFPGTSRSGATIIGALLIGVSRATAAEFTFYLAIPVMFGASVLKIIKSGLSFGAMGYVTLLVGMLVAFVVSLFVIRYLMSYIRKHDFKAFGYYRIVLGVVVLVYFFLFK